MSASPLYCLDTHAVYWQRTESLTRPLAATKSRKRKAGLCGAGIGVRPTSAENSLTGIVEAVFEAERIFVREGGRHRPGGWYEVILNCFSLVQAATKSRKRSSRLGESSDKSSRLGESSDKDARQTTCITRNETLRLSAASAQVFDDGIQGKAVLVVSYVVVAELFYLLQKHRAIDRFAALLDDLRCYPYYGLEPLALADLSALDSMPKVPCPRFQRCMIA